MRALAGQKTRRTSAVLLHYRTITLLFVVLIMACVSVSTVKQGVTDSDVTFVVL